MPDMIVPLLALPSISEKVKSLRDDSVIIRRVDPWERTSLHRFISEKFTLGWADEAMVAFSHQPISCFAAFKDNREILGFSCYECTRKAFFGPTGVAESHQGQGIGYVLLVSALKGLSQLGYVYGFIGAAGPVDFYKRAVGATLVDCHNGEGIYHRVREEGI